MLNRLFTSRKIFVCLLAMGVTAMLGACGGGDNPGEEWNYSPPVGIAPTTPIEITTVNAQNIASQAYSLFSVAQLGTELTSSQSGSPTSPTSPVPVGVQATSSVSWLDVTRKVLEIYNPSQPQTVSGVVATCDTGSITYPDSEFGIISFNSCNLGGTVIDGKIKFTGTATATSFVGSLIYNELSVSEGGVVLFSIHGEINISATYGTPPAGEGSTSTSLLAITFGAEVIDLTDYTFSYSINSSGDKSITLDYTINSTLLTGSVTVTTNPTIRLQYYSGYNHPYAGQIVISGARNTKVRMTVVDSGWSGNINVDTVTIETDADGDGEYDIGETTTLTWAEFTALY